MEKQLPKDYEGKYTLLISYHLHLYLSQNDTQFDVQKGYYRQPKVMLFSQQLFPEVDNVTLKPTLLKSEKE
jgi:hypothetical protein